MPDLDLNVSFAIPDDADGMEEILNDTTKMQAIFNEHGMDGWARLNAAYQAAFANKDKGETTDQLMEQMEARFAAMLRDNGLEASGRLDLTAEDSPINTPNPRQIGAGDRRNHHGKFYSHDAPGAAVDQLWQRPSDAIRGVIAQAEPSKANAWRDRDSLIEAANKAKGIQAAYSSHIGPSGGFLLPESFRNTMLEIAHESAVVRPRATVIPMSTPKVTIPAIHETNRSSNLFGGVTIYWTDEDTDSTESNAQFKTVTLEPDTMTGYTEVPNELMADTIAFDAYFSASFPAAMAFEEDDAFLQGNGVGRPLGVLNGGAVIEVAKETGQAADSLVYQNVLNMYARMLPTSMNRCVWLMNQDVIPELGEMALSVGTGGAPIWLLNAAAGMPMSLFGRPIIFTEKVDQLGDAGDVVLVDLGFYLIGDLQTMTATSSEHYKFKERRTAFSLVSRVDGQPWLESAITPRRGTNTLSPIVTIAARA